MGGDIVFVAVVGFFFGVAKKRKRRWHNVQINEKFKGKKCSCGWQQKKNTNNA